MAIWRIFIYYSPHTSPLYLDICALAQSWAARGGGSSVCRNDAARENVLRDHQDKSLLSKKDETPEICTGQDFHLLQTWSLPSTGGKHKGCQHWSECCDSAGQPRCRTCRREDEGRVSWSHSTRKQLPGQSAGLSGYSQLIPTPPEEGYAPDPSHMTPVTR